MIPAMAFFGGDGKSMLSARASRLRDWLLFALAALVPALAFAFLGLRALRNEEAATRREEAVALEAAAERASRLLREASERAETELRTSKLPGDQKALEAELARIAPPFADPLLLDVGGAVLVPPGPSASSVANGSEGTDKPERAPAECSALADALAGLKVTKPRAGSDSPATLAPDAARSRFLDECPTFRTPTGRWLWPVVALDELTLENGSRLASWIEAHSRRLTPAERALTLRGVRETSRMSTSDRDRALAALGHAKSTFGLVRGALRDPGVSAALADLKRSSGTTRWASRGSRGALVLLDDGRMAGFIVHRDSLARSLSSGWAELGPGRAASVVIGPAAQRAESARAESAEPRLVALVSVAPHLALRVALIDPASLAARTSRSRTAVAVAAVTATIFAFALAAFLFARMRAANRSSELRVGFVSTVSHELRTPIASVRMLAELLEQDRVEEDERGEVYEALARESRRLGETVDRLLGFSRMAAGRHVLDQKTAALADVVAESIDTFEERHPGRAVERELDDEVIVHVDPGQIQLAVDNLLANAQKYAPEGAPYRVTVSGDDDDAIITVEDHGPGIHRRDQARIFRPFERADDRLSQATEGSGIGLSLVAHVARAHGGRATVDSDIGKGARFCVRLPRAKPASSEPASSEAGDER